MRFIILFLIFLFNFQYLSAVEFLGKFEQGSFILGKTKPNSKVKVDDKKIRVSQDGKKMATLSLATSESWRD